MSKLESLYHQLTRTPSDINLLLPELRGLVENFGTPEEGPVVTEFGTRHGWSTVALLCGYPKRLTTYDIEQKWEDLDAIAIANEESTQSEFYPLHGNTLEIEIEETDILFIDTLHTGEQLAKELDRHHKKVRHYIAFHDVTSFGLVDEAPVSGVPRGYHPGLLPAILEFLETHQEWTVYKYLSHNNGLLILKRRDT